MLRTLKPLLVMLALLATPAIAYAEEPTKSYPDCGREPTDAEVAAAKGAFQAGNASFNEADYARAIDYWEDAYRRDCTANPLLLNLARAYELAGRKRQAVVSLETFLAREPNSGEKEQINRRIEVLKKKIAEEDAAATASPPTTHGATPLPPPGAAQAPDQSPIPEEKAKRSPWPWVVIGVGGAVTIVGVIGYASANKKLKDATDRCGGDRVNCMDTSAVDDGNKARTDLTTSGVVAGVGVAAVVGGVIWWVVDKKRVDSANQPAVARTRLYPVLGQQLTGLSLTGSF
jgi:tetratricopeptide (TPR) repeat protein